MILSREDRQISLDESYLSQNLSHPIAIFTVTKIAVTYDGQNERIFS